VGRQICPPMVRALSSPGPYLRWAPFLDAIWRRRGRSLAGAGKMVAGHFGFICSPSPVLWGDDGGRLVFWAAYAALLGQFRRLVCGFARPQLLVPPDECSMPPWRRRPVLERLFGPTVEQRLGLVKQSRLSGESHARSLPVPATLVPCCIAFLKCCF